MYIDDTSVELCLRIAFCFLLQLSVRVSRVRPVDYSLSLAYIEAPKNREHTCHLYYLFLFKASFVASEILAH